MPSAAQDVLLLRLRVKVVMKHHSELVGFRPYAHTKTVNVWCNQPHVGTRSWTVDPCFLLEHDNDALVVLLSFLVIVRATETWKNDANARLKHPLVLGEAKTPDLQRCDPLVVSVTPCVHLHSIGADPVERPCPSQVKTARRLAVVVGQQEGGGGGR